MEKLEFKNKVLNWLKENNINLAGKKIRIYNYRRYGLEVRIYNEPMEFTNTRKSRRKMAVDENGNNCTFGYHTTKISTYIHINEKDLESEEDKEFILESLKNF
jgi:hypothetical protein